MLCKIFGNLDSVTGQNMSCILMKVGTEYVGLVMRPKWLESELRFFPTKNEYVWLACECDERTTVNLRIDSS